MGFTDDLKPRQMEYRHHGDELVPRQQRFSQYTRSLMKALEVPVLNQFGLRPAVVTGTDQIVPLTINKDLDEQGLLDGVTTFNFHLHLPHYALTTEDVKRIHVLARQRIDLSRPHPFTAAGNREFNSLLRMPPDGVIINRDAAIGRDELAGFGQHQRIDFKRTRFDAARGGEQFSDRLVQLLRIFR